MDSIDFHAMRALCTLYETQSYTKTAILLGRTQPAISQIIKKLNTIYGVPLIDKDCMLTPQGKIFYDMASECLKLQKATSQTLAASNIKAEIFLGLPEDFASIILQSVLVDFQRLHPNVKLHVECELSKVLEKRFTEDHYDFAVIKNNKKNAHTLREEPLVWVYSQKTPNNEIELPLVLSPAPCIYRERALQGLESMALPYEHSFTSHSYQSLATAISTGMGISVLPKRMVSHPLKIYKNSQLPKLEPVYLSLLDKGKNSDVGTTLKNLIVNFFHQ